MTEKVYIDGSNKILGRLASQAAREADEETQVIILNSEEIVISGDEEDVLEEYEQKYERGSRDDGPYFPKRPDKIMKRTVTRMLPDYDVEETRVKTFIGNPENIEDFTDVDAKTTADLKRENYVKLGHVSRTLGWEGVN